MRALKFKTVYVTFKLRFDQIYQMKTTNVFSNHSGIRMEMRPRKRWSVESQKSLALEPNREFQYAQST
jgi:hypothetical protein